MAEREAINLGDNDELRRRAEELLDDRRLSRPPSPAIAGARLVEELQVHQVELELQNDELMRAQQELSHANAELRLLFELAPVPYVTLDAKLRICSRNLHARRMWGEEFTGRFAELAAVEHRHALASTLRHALASGRAASVEVAFEPPNAQAFDAVVNVATLPLTGRDQERPRLLVSALDVTAERAHREELRERQEELQGLLEAAPDAIAVVDRGVFLFANPACGALLGRTPRDLHGLPAKAFIDERDHPVLADLLADPSGPDAGSVELRLRSHASQQGRVAEVRCVALEFRGRTCAVLIARDLSDRRRMEAQMAQAERMATVGMLVAGVAHEVNNPLAFVMLALESVTPMLSEVVDERARERIGGRLAEISDGCERIAGIIADLRDFYRVEDHATRIVPNDVIARTLRMAGPKLAHRSRIEHHLGMLPTIECNEGRLAQVLVNLVVNASQAMPAGRSVQNNLIAVRSWATERDVCIAVEDNGVGIAPEVQAHLFDPFFTTRAGDGGTGLGLAISNSLMQQMGGWIELESEPGRGSRFILHLSRRTSSLRAPEAPLRSDVVPMPSGNLRILLVDDEPPVARALQRTLATLGCVEVCHSGNEAIARLSIDRAFDVVLCDMVMLDGSGIDVARYLHDGAPELFRRLVFMSGMGQIQDELTEDVPCVQKPFDMNMLRSLLGQVAGGGHTGKPTQAVG